MNRRKEGAFALGFPSLLGQSARNSANVRVPIVGSNLDRLHGPEPGRAIEPVVLVEDTGPIHFRKRALEPSEGRKQWLTIKAARTQRH